LFQATDRDSGNFGKVEYLPGTSSDSVPQDPPFELHAETGEVVTTMDMEFVTYDRFRFSIQARDNPGQSNDHQTTNGEVIVSLAEPDKQIILFLHLQLLFKKHCVCLN